MSDNSLPPDLDRLVAIETYLQLQLDEVRDRIATVRADQLRGEVRQWRASRPAPEWYAEMHATKDGPRPLQVHAGECGIGDGQARTLTQAEIRHALAEGVPACPFCNPDQVLGLDL